MQHTCSDTNACTCAKIAAQYFKKKMLISLISPVDVKRYTVCAAGLRLKK